MEAFYFSTAELNSLYVYMCSCQKKGIVSYSYSSFLYGCSYLLTMHVCITIFVNNHVMSVADLFMHHVIASIEKHGHKATNLNQVTLQFEYHKNNDFV